MKTVEEVLAAVLGIDATAITDQSSPSSIEEWDSFNGLLLVTELEKNFKVKFSIDEIIAVKNVRDIKNALKRHGSGIR